MSLHHAPNCLVTCTYITDINPVAKALYKEITAKVGYEGDADRKTTPSEPPNVTKIGDTEIWWDHAISTTTKIPHNRPDVVI